MAEFLGGLSANSTAGFGPVQAAPRDREGSMSFAIENLDPTIKRLYQATVQLEGMVARLMGPHPTPITADKTEQETPSLINRLNQRGRAMALVADRFDELVRQLDQVL